MSSKLYNAVLFKNFVEQTTNSWKHWLDFLVMRAKLVILDKKPDCLFKNSFLCVLTLAGWSNPALCWKQGQNKNSFLFGIKSSKSCCRSFCLSGFMGGSTAGVEAAGEA